MGTGVRGTGGAGWQLPQNDWTGQLYNQVLRETGNPQTAEQAVANAQRALDDIYHTTMIRTGGDEMAANATRDRYVGEVMRIASLMPAIQGTDSARAGTALREAWGIMQNAGMTNRSDFYPWLHENVQSDDALRAGGFDPLEVHRPPDTPWAHADLDALLQIGREMLERYVSPTGQRFTPDQIEAQLDAARTAARRLRVGDARTYPGGAAPAGTVTVAAFNFPRRV